MTEHTIDSFKDEYGFLSNFYPCAIYHDGLEYKCVEAAFQAAKCAYIGDRAGFTALGPGEAKKLGRTVTLRKDWEDVKLFIMAELLAIKFAFNPKLMDMLRDTSNAELIEGNSWHDNFWGSCSCQKCKSAPKHNNLGKLLMVVRGNAKPPANQTRYRTTKIKTGEKNYA